MKKVLAWAVALALVLSSFTMAFAADTKTSADFSDADQIHYTEAVDVMVATGIINGYPDGTFGPAKTVKRSEMAKMIAVMMNGGEDIGDTFAGSCPFKDSQNHWAAGYIAYCAAEHIIDGRSADVFDPEAEVTGTEVAKMALTSLGYDSQIQGYTGENWAAAVLKDAKKNDLFEDMDGFVPAKPCSREEAAQILFNALQATEVEYDTSTSVIIGDATVNVNSKVQDVTKPESKDYNDNGTIQLYEDVFDGDLVKNPSTSDDFGRPAHDWTYDKEDVGTYNDEADETFNAEDKFDTADAAVKDYNEDYAAGTVTLNGAPQSEDCAVVEGDIVELYDADAQDAEGNDIYNVVILRYVADKISDVDTDVKKDDSDKGTVAYVTFDKAGKKYPGHENAAKDLPGYTAGDYEEDAVIAVAVYGAAQTGKIIDSYVPEKVSGELTKMNTTKGTYTVDGTSYDAIGSGIYNPDKVTTEQDVDLYLINDYAAAIIKVADKDIEYGVLLKVAETTWGDVQAKILTAEGEEATVDVDENNGVFDRANYGKVIAYSVNDDETVNGETCTYGDTYTAENTMPAMTAKGLIAGKDVVEDVVVFDYDGTDESDADNYEVLGYNDLKNAEDIEGYFVMNKDGDIVAVLSTAGVTSKDTLVAFYSDATQAKSGSDTIYEVEIMTGGEAVTYDTKAGLTVEGFNSGDIVKVSFNADKEITNLKLATAKEAADPTDDFGTANYVLFNKGGLVSDKSGNKLTIANYQINVQGAAVYKMVNGKIDADEYSLSDIVKGETTVAVYQLSDESDTWDAIVIQEATPN